MIPFPTRRWFVGAVLLAPAWALARIHPDGALIAASLDLLWITSFVIDALATAALDVLRVEREVPPAFSVGRALPIRVTWTNPGDRRLRLLVRESIPAPLLAGPTPVRALEIAPQGTATEWLSFTPWRRGEGDGGRFWLRALGPLGLSRTMVRRDFPWRAIVFPDLTDAALAALPTRRSRRREAGLRNVRRIGEGRVFETLREWVPGDDTRSIDWKATARRGKTMARQYEDERRQQLLILVDAGRTLTTEIDGRARLESAIDAALQLAYSATAHDDDVGLLVFADDVQHYVPPRRGRRALRAIVEALATVDGRMVEPDYPAAFAFVAARMRKRALMVLFTDVIDRTASEALVARTGTLRPRHLPVAVTIRDPALERTAYAHATTATDAYERAAAEELLSARAEALAQMRGRGVVVVDVPPAQAARSVVEQYQVLKRKGML